MKNESFVEKTRQKNLRDFELRVHQDDFLKEVKAIRQRYALPLRVDRTETVAGSFQKVRELFFRVNLLVLPFVALKFSVPEASARLDERRMDVLMDLDRQLILDHPEPKSSNEHGDHFSDLAEVVAMSDPTSPQSALSMVTLIRLYLESPSGGQALAALPPKTTVGGTVITNRDMVFLMVAESLRWLVYGEFLKNFWGLMSRHNFGKEWFEALFFYLLTDLDPRRTGFVPGFNVFVSRSPEGNVILEETRGSTIRGMKAAYSSERSSETAPSHHNYPRKNQGRDLEIWELTKQRQQMRKNDRESARNADDYDDEECVAYDVDIADKVLGPPRFDPLEAIPKKEQAALKGDEAALKKAEKEVERTVGEATNRVNVVRQARQRLKKRMGPKNSSPER